MKTEMYTIVFSNDAKKDLKELSKKAPHAVKKLSRLLEEIQEHRITHEHRLVYRIYDEVIEVLVLSAFGHYKK